jgi:hypothetical protein
MGAEGGGRRDGGERREEGGGRKEEGGGRKAKFNSGIKTSNSILLLEFRKINSRCL